MDDNYIAINIEILQHECNGNNVYLPKLETRNHKSRSKLSIQSLNMSSKHHYLIAFILLSWGIFIPLSAFSATNYSFVNYSTREGLSQNYVNSIFMDSRGYIWICTNFGLNRFNGTNFKQFNRESNKSGLDNDRVRSITEDKNGILWILTEKNVNRFDYLQNQFKLYPIGATSVLSDKKGRIWATTNKGLEYYDESSDKFVLSEQAFVDCTLEDKDNKGNLYLLFKNVLLIYNTYTKRCNTHIVPVVQQLVDKRNSVYVDNKYNVWIATPTKGCYKLDAKTQMFSGVANKRLNELISGECGDISGDNENLFFATAFNGFVVYNIRSNSVTEVSVETNPKNNIEQNNINHVYVDRTGGIWLGTADYGVEYLSPYSNHFEYYKGNQFFQTFRTIGRFEEFGNDIYIGSETGLLIKNKFSTQINPYSLSTPTNNWVNIFKAGKFIKKENESELWTSYYNNGLYLCDIKNKKIKFRIKDDKYFFIKNIVKDAKNRNWILSLTSFGLIQPTERRILSNNAVERLIKKTPLSFYSMVVDANQCIYIGTREKGILKYYPEGDSCVNLHKDNCKWITNNFITALYIDNKKNVWVGTFGGGICRYNPVTGGFKIFDKKNGLFNDCISGIVEDQQQNIWCTSIDGISCIFPNNRIKNFYQKNGYPINQAEPQSIKCLSNNQIIVGGNNGFTIFSPFSFKTNMHKPQLEFSKITIHGENKEEQKINSAIRDNRKSNFNISVNYNSFPIEIEYSTIDFTYPETNKYAYKLSDVGKEWTDLDNKKSFLISDLKSGNYTFSIKACNNDGVWNEAGISLQIHVNPPFWLSWWAYIIYLIAIGWIIRTYMNYYKTKLRLEHDINIKQIEKTNIEQFYERKLVLFTNFSHELRTPLTLISGPINQLLKDTEQNTQSKYLLNLIKNNSERLTFFVNQLMDLRKLDTGNFKLAPGHQNLYQFATKILQDFLNLAESRTIKLELDIEDKNLELYFDKQLLESVFFNLLSNAFKFTPSNGTIVVGIHSVNYDSLPYSTKKRLESKTAIWKEYIEICISDTGKGIDPEHLEQVFDRFYQIGSGLSELTDTKGTGVGLHLSNNIVNIHDGVIFAERNTPIGTVFKIYLPCVVEEQTNDNVDILYDKKIVSEPDTVDIPEKAIAKSSFTILIVEDDLDIRQYVKLYLSAHYKVIEAENGQDALDIILNKEISLVISDVMMPVMDGLELCKKIKGNIQINDIPVILLTARTADEHIIEGYELNADDFISKPFNIDILLARIKNILQKNILLRQKFATHINVANKETESLTLDEKFMGKVYALINKNIEETTFELEDICSEIGISKVHLNRKIKVLTGLTPSKLILKTRLNKAQQLIERGERSITELAYSCGFSDTNYFSRCFKQEYKMTPSEYIKTQKDTLSDKIEH
jgi:signal transduction histidine kinase/DNA-binding response OmpR family regulator/ligand-binding sensor domain-containing protein